MESHINDLSETMSSKLYELNAIIMKASIPNPAMNVMPGATKYHHMVRPYLYG